MTTPEAHPAPPFPNQAQSMPGGESQMQPRPDHGEQTYRGRDRLQGRVALITGADSGIGKAVALAFAREGADVVASYLNEHEDAEDTRRLVEESGRKCVLVPGDISDDAHCRALVQQTIIEFGTLDHLVNNAAFQMRRETIDAIPPDEWDFTVRTNLYGTFQLCRSAWPHLKPGACVINTVSIQASKPSPELLAYAATKGALVTFTKALALQGAPRGIRVNAVAPGPVWTPLIPGSTPPEQTAQFGTQDPFGRPAQPSELAPAYVFLASNEESGFVNGEILGVHGGMPVSF